MNAARVPANLKADLCRALGSTYADIKIYPGTVSRTASGKLEVMQANDGHGANQS